MKLALLPTKNSLSPTLRKRMIGLLNQQLADVLDLGWQARQAHWNVKGPAFISLHELFGTVADDLDNHADELAERSVQLGGLALGTLQAVVNSSRLPAYPVTLTAGRKHLTALTGAVALVARTSRVAIESADQAGDADTADLFTSVSRSLDKILWKLEAHLMD